MAGPKAFPHPKDASLHDDFAGMDLRDYFAGQAMIAILPHVIGRRPNQSQLDELAKISYEVADAMVKRR